VDPRAETAIHRAMALAPRSVDPIEHMVRYELHADVNRAAVLSRQLVQEAPKRGDVRWDLAVVNRLQMHQDLAADNASEAFRLGFHPKSVKELQWLIDYYADKKDYVNLLELCEKAVWLDPRDTEKASNASTKWLILHYWDVHDYRKLVEVYQSQVQNKPDYSMLYELATIHALLGEKEKARIVANRALEVDPSRAPQVKMFLKSLQQ
jgi:tetratricopeptide (TPR) repeat protein